MTPPSTAELMRRLDELFTEVRGLRRALEDGYVRKDVFVEVRQADGVIHADLREDVDRAHGRVTELKKDQVASRRLAMSAFVAPLVVAVVAALIVFAILGPAS